MNRPAGAGPLPDSGGAPLRAADRVDPARAAELHALLGRPGPPPREGAPLPPLWHAILFRDGALGLPLAPDGGLAEGGLIPETGLPRRRRGGGRLERLGPLAVGQPVERVSCLQNVALRQGGAGPMTVVTLRHEITGPDGPALREEEDLVFRSLSGPDDPPRPDPPLRDERPSASRSLVPLPLDLFRFAAATGDAHRIHWDADHARDVEGEAGLLVSPGLILLHLAALLADHERRVPQSLEWRTASEAQAGAELRLGLRVFGASAELWATNADRRLVLEARMQLKRVEG